MRYVIFLLLSIVATYGTAGEAPSAWKDHEVAEEIKRSILYISIADPRVRGVETEEVEEEVVDLLKVNNARIVPMWTIDGRYKNSYEGYSQVRLGLYERMLRMLEYLPEDVGIAYFEGLRPLWKQKEYFDKKFAEILEQVGDVNVAYEETSKVVSPFIDNVPTHGTGAAIDMTLFRKVGGGKELLDMGKFDTVFGENAEQDTFSVRASLEQRKNRLLLLRAASRAGITNYGYEWWHYSYGDKAWGYVNGRKARYGLVVDRNDPILSIDKDSYLRSKKTRKTMSHF